jgi:molybdate transport system substrate-binding protein
LKGWRLVVGAVVFVLAAGCSAAAPPTASNLTVLAASSLSGTLNDLAVAWTSTHHLSNLDTQTGSTATLRMQIEQGSPADVLLGADTTNAQALIDEGDGVGPLTNYATNALTIIVPANNPKSIQGPADLVRPGVCIIGAGADVPITEYATQLVANLAMRPEYGADFAIRYAANVCSQEDNVGAVVNKVSLGEGDAAIVYVTDAKSAHNISQIAVPAESNVLATYGGVAVKASPNESAAADFLTWLRGADAQAVLQAHGFGAAA